MTVSTTGAMTQNGVGKYVSRPIGRWLVSKAVMHRLHELV